ncbi:MAG: GGDEF domain-containing protein [Lachnospiraceae bacterium]|nr:GGDEF domain-containing protein [Lachnospiraceae bacterium]
MKFSEGKDYKVVAFVMACVQLEATELMIKQVAKRCEEHNCKVVFYSSHSDFYKDALVDQMDNAEMAIMDIIPVERFDAIVFMAETFKNDKLKEKFVKRAQEANVPMVSVENEIDGCINISYDYTSPFREIVKHMVEFHGYRKVNFMSGNKGISFAEERLQVYKEVLLENGIEYDERRVYYGDFWEMPTVSEMNRMFEDWPEMPEAIICANDVMAITVCDCLRKRGYRVPQDVAVSGFDGVEIGKFHEPRLLTCENDIKLTIDTIFDIVSQDKLVAEGKTVVIPAYNKLVIGGSCGCDRMSASNGAREVVELKTTMQEQMVYQANLGRTIVNYGGKGDKNIVETIIPKHLGVLNYYDFWFIARHRLLTEDYLISGGAPDDRNVIHYIGDGKKADVEYSCGLDDGEIIPDFYRHLESGQPLLVMSVPNEEDPYGYAVIKFDKESFKCVSYSGFLSHFRYVLEMVRVRRMLIDVYRNDVLTGIYNRNGFYEKMDQLMSNVAVKKLTVISIDMFKFKYINDNFGHSEGDKALNFVGTTIKNSLKSGELAARIGGDEFLIILYADNQEERAEEIISYINSEADFYNKNNDKDYKVLFSIGTCTEYVNERSLDHFLREADEKMYAHKNKQKEEDR